MDGVERFNSFLNNIIMNVFFKNMKNLRGKIFLLILLCLGKYMIGRKRWNLKGFRILNLWICYYFIEKIIIKIRGFVVFEIIFRLCMCKVYKM